MRLVTLAARAPPRSISSVTGSAALPRMISRLTVDPAAPRRSCRARTVDIILVGFPSIWRR